MARSAWLTPDPPATGVICRRILIPNSVDFLAIVTGALNELIYNYNFEQYGSLTPDETATIFQDVFDQFCLNGSCRMIGEIVVFAGPTMSDPIMLPCDGASLLRTDYPDLFTVIGVTYGSADSTHFNVPDLRGRAFVGTGTGPGLSPRTLADVFGEETHTLITSEVPGHSHTDSGHAHVEGNATATLIAIGAGIPAASAVPTIGVTANASANLDSSGGDGDHNNMQPSLALSYFIVAL